MIRDIDDFLDHVVVMRDDKILVNGKYYELTTPHDKVYSDLKYVNFDGELWVEE